MGSEEHDAADRAKVTQVLKALLGRADPNIIGREGITAAHMAAMGDSSKLLQLLSQFKVGAALLLSASLQSVCMCCVYMFLRLTCVCIYIYSVCIFIYV